jgi:hypothetical protein
MTFGLTFETRPSRSAPAFVHALAALGLLTAVAGQWPLASNPMRAWIGMSALYGWLLATWGIETRLMQGERR